MSNVDRTGLYKGKIKDFGVVVTRKAKLPQLVVTLLATELYDDANEAWQAWEEYEQTITGYFVLVTLNSHGEVTKCLNYDQVMEATGWNGETYSGLAAMNLKDKVVQFRVAEDEFNGTVSLKVSWIAAENAEVGLRKLSGKDLLTLDAQFGVAPAKPRTAAKPAAPKPTANPTVGANSVVSAPTPESAPSPTPGKTTAPKPPAPPKAGKGKKGPAVGESCTEDEAYQACLAANDKLEKPVPSEIVDDYWVAAVTKIAANTEKVTGEEWVQIRDIVLLDIEIPY